MAMLPLGVLLIHGFGGGSYEVAPLAARLKAQGFDCRVVHLAGHEDGKKSIDYLPYTRWIESARAEYCALASTHRVACVGFSMGGLIAAALNAEQPLEALVLINTPIRFWNLPQIARNLRANPTPALRRYFVESAGRTPPRTLVQFMGLWKHTQKQFTSVVCPTLIVQAEDDDTVWPSSARWLCGQIEGRCVLYRPMKGGHAVLQDAEECGRIARRTLALLRGVQEEF